jgi:hypothetical protein
MLGVYGSFAQPGTIAPVIFGIYYLLALIWLLYVSLTRPGLIHYPFNRIVELGPAIGVWVTGSALC